MPSQDPFPSAPAAKSRRTWGCAVRWLLTFIGLTVIGTGASYWADSYFTNRAWTDAEAEADLLDPRWRLFQIEADREEVPERENAALRIIAITRQQPDFRVADAKMYPQIFEGLTPTATLNDEQLALIRIELDKIREPLADARQLKNLDRGRYPIQYTDDFLGTLVPEQQASRILADWLLHDAYLLAHENQCDDAVDSCRAIMNVGRAMGDEPLLISFLVRIAMQMVAVETLERVLAQGKVSEEPLQVMQAALMREIDNDHFLQGLRGERAGDHLCAENIRAGKLHFVDMANPAKKAADQGFSMTESFVDFQVLRTYPSYLRHMNRAVEICKKPIHERHDEIQAWQEVVKGRKFNPGLWVLAPQLVKLHQANCRSQATFRAATVAIACERFRLRHGHWPESLAVLVEAKLLDAIPADPMDNQPIRFRPTKDGIVVYSIGIDQVDDQGHIDRDRAQAPGVDVGFRVWNETARRQPALPTVADKQGQ